MPIYDFQCKKCKNTFEDFLHSFASPNPKCKCGSKTKRLVSTGFAIDMDGIVISSPRGRAELHANGSRIV